MKIQQEISGSDLHDLLWGQGLRNFESLVDAGMDEDEILSAVEELLGGTSEMPDLTAINDLIWFEDEEVRKFIGCSHEDELQDWLAELESEQDDWLAKMEKLLAENPDDEDLALLRDGLAALPDEVQRFINYQDMTDDLKLILDNLVEWSPNYEGLGGLDAAAGNIRDWFEKWGWIL